MYEFLEIYLEAYGLLRVIEDVAPHMFLKYMGR
jgi:hypothetical protein